MSRLPLALLLLALLLPACGRRHPKPDPVDQRLHEMRQAVRNDDPDAAVEAIDAAIAARPADAELPLIKARMLFDFARYPAAAEAAEAAVERAEQSKRQARDNARAALLLEEESQREQAREQAIRAHGDARRHQAQAHFTRAAALRSAGRESEADEALDRAKLAFDELAKTPPGEDEAEQARAELSALLHKAVILRLQGHRESAAFQIRQIAAKFDHWQGKDYWIDMLTSDDAERRLYDAMVEGVGDEISDR